MSGATPADKWLGAIASRMVDFARRRAIWVVVGYALAGLLLLRYTVGHLGINTDTADMISEELPWRQAFIEYREAFPQFIQNLIVVIDADTPELGRAAQLELSARLMTETELYEHVYAPGAGAFFDRQGMLYLERDELEALTDNAAAMQPFLGTLTRDPTLTGLVTVLGRATEFSDEAERGLDLEPVFLGLETAFAAARDGRFRQMSWQQLLVGEDSATAATLRLIIIKPRFEFERFQPAGPAVGRVRGLARELELDAAHGVRVRLTGPVALQHEELKSVQASAGLAGLLALVMVTAILFFALRSVRLMLASVLTLVSGLITTAAFAALAVGHLNLISVAFAVLYIGLGVDFTIHFNLRYRELRMEGAARAEGLRLAANDVGGSLVLCALTTSVGFFAFYPTEFVGVSELGLISGVGMYISLLTTLTLLPALLTVMPAGEHSPGWANTGLGVPSPVRFHRAIRYGAILAALISLALLPLLRFDSNPLNLRDQDAESVVAFRDLLADERATPSTLSVLAPDLQTAEALADQLAATEEVQRAMTVADFVPGDQNDKLILIEDMAMLLGADLSSVPAEPRRSDPVEQLDAVDQLIVDLYELAAVAGPEQADTIRQLRSTAQSYRESLEQLSEEQRADRLRLLENNLMSGLPPTLDVLSSALEARSFTLDDLPVELTSRWRTADGRHRVEVFPSEDVSDDAAAERFVDSVQTVVPRATGLPVVHVEAGSAVVSAFRQAFVTATLLVFGMLLVLLRNWRDPLLVLTPVVLAALLTAAVAVILDMPINFANIIALPLLLGVGVDNGIHIVHRYRTTLPPGVDLWHTSTARAVVFSALTTIFSFGNLAISAHVGMASMGRLLTIGMVLSVICTLVVLPTLLTRRARA